MQRHGSRRYLGSSCRQAAKLVTLQWHIPPRGGPRARVSEHRDDPVYLCGSETKHDGALYHISWRPLDSGTLSGTVSDSVAGGAATADVATVAAA